MAGQGKISCDPFFARSVPWYNAYAKKGHAVTNVRLRTCFTDETDGCAEDALTYEEDDLTLHTSTGALRYVSLGDAIVPSDAKEAARVDDTITMVLMAASRLSSEITAPLFFVKDSKARAATGIATVQPILQYYETLLSTQDYVAGDRLSLADFVFAPEVDQFLIVAPALQTQLLDGRVAIAAYLERMRQVDGYTAGFEAAKAYFEALRVPQKLAVKSAVLECAHFVEAVDDEVVCPLCHRVVVSPVQCKEGHVFCKGCIETALCEKEECPVDKGALRVADLSPVLAVQAMVNRKRVRCPHAAQHTDEKDGCDWVGRVSERPKHIDTECGYTSVPCPHDGCEVRVQRRAVEEHAASCGQRVEACEHCGEGVAVSQRAQHEQVCPLVAVECPFKEVGCTAPSMPRKDAAAHAGAAAEKHAALALTAQGDARKEATAKDTLALQVVSLTEQVAVKTEVARLEATRRQALEHDLTAAEKRLSRSLEIASRGSVAVRVEWKIEGIEAKIAAGTALCSRAESLQSASAQVFQIGLRVAFTATDTGVFLRLAGVPSGTKVDLAGSSVTLLGASAAKNHVGEFRHCVALGNGYSGWEKFVSLAELRRSCIAEDGSITLHAKLCAAAVLNL